MRYVLPLWETLTVVKPLFNHLTGTRQKLQTMQA